MTNQWRKQFDNDVLCEAIGIPVDITTAWLLAASSGWSSDAWSQTLDFSPYSPVGTKMVNVPIYFVAGTATIIDVYARRYGDEEVAATPAASGEVGCLISASIGATYATTGHVWLPLSVDGRVQFAAFPVPVQPRLYVGYPRMYLL